ncbi:MAG: hypothetical protein JSR82_18985 [Verrucomicrobia bacterium]|nr:hypothetical protein [Verrucomicrobiota bacterium]
MDITSPRVLKLKAALFLVIFLLSASYLALMFWPLLHWPAVALFGLCLWSICRAYYFCFYVLQHYADPSFRYAGLLDALLHLSGWRRKG